MSSTTRCRRVLTWLAAGAVIAVLLPTTAAARPSAGDSTSTAGPVDLTLTIEDNPDPYVPEVHDTFEYRSTVSNRGPNTASKVTFEHQIPPSLVLDFVSVSTAQGTCVYDFDLMTGGATVRCALGSVAPGQSVEIVEQYGPCSDGGVTMTEASAASANTETAPANNEATASTTFVPLGLSVCAY